MIIAALHQIWHRRDVRETSAPQCRLSLFINAWISKTIASKSISSGNYVFLGADGVASAIWLVLGAADGARAVLNIAGFAKVVLKEGETLVARAEADSDPPQGTEFNGNLLHFIQ